MTSTPRDTAISTANDVHSNGHTIAPRSAQNPIFELQSNSTTAASTPSLIQSFNPVPPPYLPGGARSLPAISFRAFCLGLAAGLCSCLTVLLIFIQMTYESSPAPKLETPYGIGYLWRIPFFITTLAIFHYLEFDMTARYNTVDAKVSSFLLFNNGWAYNAAHCAAMLECAVTWLFRSRFAPRLPSLSSLPSLPVARPNEMWRMATFPTIPSFVPVVLGLTLIIVGQITRSLAMKTAGTSFNHIVQATKKVDHVLVTNGVYGLCRHPSYFGFFWWGLGTQIILGNRICFLGYGVILWKFFSHRIANEERHLIYFFGQAYVEYRKKTPALIPFIS